MKTFEIKYSFQCYALDPSFKVGDTLELRLLKDAGAYKNSFEATPQAEIYIFEILEISHPKLGNIHKVEVESLSAWIFLNENSWIQFDTEQMLGYVEGAKNFHYTDQYIQDLSLTLSVKNLRRKFPVNLFIWAFETSDPVFFLGNKKANLLPFLNQPNGEIEFLNFEFENEKLISIECFEIENFLKENQNLDIWSSLLLENNLLQDSEKFLKDCKLSFQKEIIGNDKLVLHIKGSKLHLEFVRKKKKHGVKHLFQLAKFRIK